MKNEAGEKKRISSRSISTETSESEAFLKKEKRRAQFRIFLLTISVFWILCGLSSEHRQGPLAQESIPGSELSRSAEPNLKVLLKYWEEHYRRPSDYVIETFGKKKWVFLGEYHRIKHDVELVVSLIPELHARTDVRYLAFEFLTHEATDEANALITAKDYDRRKTMAFFRRQFPSWAYEEYLDIFRSAWESNRKFGRSRGIFRLAGLHPGINWELINYSEDPQVIAREKEKQQKYDELMALWLETDFLKKNHKALIYTGIAHSTGKFAEYVYGDKRGKQLLRMGNMVYKEPYKSDMFFVCLHSPFFDHATGRDIYPFDGILDRMMKSFQKDIGFDVIGTPFSILSHRQRSRYSITDYTFSELYDGYIMFKPPIKEYRGVTCIEDWITDQEEFRYYWRNLANKETSFAFSKIPFEKFKKDFCSPRPDQGADFKKRFVGLPDIK